MFQQLLGILYMYSNKQILGIRIFIHYTVDFLYKHYFFARPQEPPHHNNFQIINGIFIRISYDSKEYVDSPIQWKHFVTLLHCCSNFLSS